MAVIRTLVARIQLTLDNATGQIDRTRLQDLTIDGTIRNGSAVNRDGVPLGDALMYN